MSKVQMIVSSATLYNLPDNGGLVPARAGHSRHGPDAQQPPWSSAHRPFAYLPQPGPSNRPSFLDEPPLSNQPLNAAPNLRCNTCKQMQPVVTYESRSMLGLSPRTRTPPVSAMSTVHTRSLPKPTACATLPFSAPSQNPSHPSQQPSDGATLKQYLDAWVQKVEVKVQEWLAPLQAQVRSFATELDKVQRSQPHTQPQTALSGLAAQPALSCSLPLPSSLLNPGEWSLFRLFPWVSSEIANTISLDHLTIVDLIKLCNPASSTVSKETPTMLTVQGIQINITSTSSTRPLKAFFKAILDITTFCQVWVVYVSLRTAASFDLALGSALNHFLVHVIDLDRNYPCVNITEYVLTICQKWFGHTDTLAWAVCDTEAFQDHLSLAPPKKPHAAQLKPKCGDTCWC
ncbi:hypothetical protein NDA10_006333 [Ustilago hordei]|nr:hypothetical protein NDA10_006333 [Ustilago hordei]UTT93487.1 hypothetical protein NDA17_000631 [Ustilago hordei]